MDEDGAFRKGRDGGAGHDARVEVADPIYLFKSLNDATQFPLSCRDAADANDDGIVNTVDGDLLLNLIFIGAPVPPPPFPEQGVDPTPDDPLDCQTYGP